MDSSELANRAIKNLKGHSQTEIKKAVLYACTESPDLIPQTTIDEAVARITRGIYYADKMTK